MIERAVSGNRIVVVQRACLLPNYARTSFELVALFIMITNFTVAQILITVDQMDFEILQEKQNPKALTIVKFIL